MKGTWFYHPGAIIAGRLMAFLGGARIEGLERVPRTGPFIIIANHCSQMDPPVLGWATGHQIGRVIHFMAKEEMHGWPIIGWLADRAAVFFVRRGEGDRAFQRLALSLLASGKPIGIFPEGTRSPSGELYRFRSGLARVAADARVPTVPVGMIGAAVVWPRRERPMARRPAPGTVQVRFGDVLAPPGQDARSRRAFTRQVHRQVAELCEQPLKDAYAPIAGGTVPRTHRKSA